MRNYRRRSGAAAGQLVLERETFSTSQLARALGVSESSVKRWVDGGGLAAARTRGGHRRIALPEALRFARAAGLKLVEPALLGLAQGAPAAAGATAEEQAGDTLLRLLLEGDEEGVRAYLLALYAAGWRVAALADGPLRRAMARIGELWRHDPGGILAEHRATDLAIHAVNQLRAVVPAPPPRPVAVGGAPEGDPYLLPSLLAAATLADAGLRAVNLGPHTPLDALEQAAAGLQPALVWLSVSDAGAARALLPRLGELAQRLAKERTVLAVGGQGLAGRALPASPNLVVGASLAELAALARGVLAATP